YGKPRFVADFRDIVRLGSDGQYTVNEVRLDIRFGPARSRGGPLEQRHYDIAHSLQVVLEETVLKLARWLHQLTHADALCLAGGGVAPFMLFVFDVRADKADRIPAVRHVDGTARVQTINRGQNPAYYDLLRAFHARTGVPVLVNTSFNTRGEPIVCTPRDAV